MTDGDFVTDSIRLPQLSDGKYSRGVVGLVTAPPVTPCSRIVGHGGGARQHWHGALSRPATSAGHGAFLVARGGDRQGPRPIMGGWFRRSHG